MAASSDIPTIHAKNIIRIILCVTGSVFVAVATRGFIKLIKRGRKRAHIGSPHVHLGIASNVVEGRDPSGGLHGFPSSCINEGVETTGTSIGCAADVPHPLAQSVRTTLYCVDAYVMCMISLSPINYLFGESEKGFVQCMDVSLSCCLYLVLLLVSGALMALLRLHFLRLASRNPPYDDGGLQNKYVALGQTRGIKKSIGTHNGFRFRNVKFTDKSLMKFVFLAVLVTALLWWICLTTGLITDRVFAELCLPVTSSQDSTFVKDLILLLVATYILTLLAVVVLYATKRSSFAGFSRGFSRSETDNLGAKNAEYFSLNELLPKRPKSESTLKGTICLWLSMTSVWLPYFQCNVMILVFKANEFAVDFMQIMEVLLGGFIVIWTAAFDAIPPIIPGTITGI